MFCFSVCFLVFLGCKSSESITPINNIQDVYIGGYDSISKANGKIWKNDNIIFSNESQLSSQIFDIFISGNDVYAVGIQYNYGGLFHSEATLWKNGIATILGDKKYNSQANSIFVSGSDVYVCGYQFSSNGMNAMVWKNGIPSSIASYGNLSSIFVSGQDVYTCGNIGIYPNQGLSVFKNSKEIYFEKGWAYPTAIFVSGNDVYVSGYGTNNNVYTPGYGIGIGYVAKLWKNGVASLLDDGKTHSVANDVFVSGGNVFAVGYKTSSNAAQSDQKIAVLWNNGVAINLTNDSSRAAANSVFVMGEDVYVCGSEFEKSGLETKNIGKVWKNGISSFISKTSSNFNPTSIFVVK
jgi:hypothetical protein